MTELIFHTDRRLHISACDDNVAALSGKARSRILGKKYDEVFPKIRLKDRDAVSEAFRQRKTITLKKYRFGCIHSFTSADIRISPVKNSNGVVKEVKVAVRPVAACGVARKLDHSQRFIDIGKIASTLAHGVRNPLNAIKGAVVYLRDKYAAEQPLHEFTQIMEDEITRLEEYIARFLNSSGPPTDPAPTDINVLIDKIKAFFSLQAYTNRVRCVFEPGDVPLLNINPFHLEQAVLNVANNALEAMKTGGELKIATRTDIRKDRLYLVIEISDTGPGIASSALEGMAASRRGGKGFGLLLAYEMVKLYGGHMEIASEKSRGTTVRFYLPIPAASGKTAS